MFDIIENIMLYITIGLMFILFFIGIGISIYTFIKIDLKDRKKRKDKIE